MRGRLTERRHGENDMRGRLTERRHGEWNDMAV